MIWLIALIALAVGGLAGYYLARHFGDSEQRAATLQKELDKAREEHAAYRRDVSQHFTKTAVAVNQLTESYRDVHQQLSEGAWALCDDATAETALAFDQSRLINAPAVESPTAPDTTAPETDAMADAPTTPTEPNPGTKSAAEAKPSPEPATETTNNDPGTSVPPPEEIGSATASSEDTPNASGGASWTPASDPEATEPVQPPRDYAEENTAPPPSAQRH